MHSQVQSTHVIITTVDVRPELLVIQHIQGRSDVTVQKGSLCLTSLDVSMPVSRDSKIHRLYNNIFLVRNRYKLFNCN